MKIDLINNPEKMVEQSYYFVTTPDWDEEDYTLQYRATVDEICAAFQVPICMVVGARPRLWGNPEIRPLEIGYTFQSRILRRKRLEKRRITRREDFRKKKLVGYIASLGKLRRHIFERATSSLANKSVRG